MNDRRRFDGLCFDPSDGALRSGDSGAERKVSLRPQVARLLSAFLAAPNQVLSREALVGRVWDGDRVVDFEAGLSALIRELRLAIGEVGGDPGQIETIPRRGYRFHVDRLEVEPVIPSGPTGSDATGVDSSAVAPKHRSQANRRWRGWLVAAVLVLIAMTVLWVLQPEATSDSAAADSDVPLRLAVLPFVRYVDEVQQPLAELRAADAMLAALWNAELARVELIGRSSLAPYGGVDRVAQRVAEDLGAALIVEGSVSDGAAGWRLDVRLLRMPGGAVIWSGSRSIPPGMTPDVWAEAASLVEALAADWPDRTLARALALP